MEIDKNTVKISYSSFTSELSVMRLMLCMNVELILVGSQDGRGGIYSGVN